ncbi:MAG: N-acetyl-gamma-glutamyl-phosphate reductase [Dermatophilaceae bacterium]
MIRAAVAGASGYAGGEILRLLLAHPEFEVGAVTAGSSAGERLGTIHRNLTPLADRVLTDTTVATLAGHDVVFLALPHGHSAALAAQLPDEVVIIDCGADFRLESQEAWTAFYDTPYAGSWPYGMPELSVGGGATLRPRLVGARRIAVPGCYPTGISLALAPGLAAGVLDPRDIVVVAASGSSGAGKSLKAHLLGAEVMGSMSPYGVGGGHRHTPEIEQNLSRAAGSPVTISFTPTLAPMPRGILATCTARLAEGGDPAVVRSVWESAYAHEPFVHLLPEGDWPRTADVLGSNNVHLGLIVDTHAGRVVVVSAVDNLTKGTAGAAVQCANLALGFEETLGLPQTGVAP